VEMLIRRGQVQVAGSMCREPGFKVPSNEIASVRLDGEPLDRPFGVTVILNKPVGYSCSHDERESPLVDELLPAAWADRSPRPEWAGRLDRDTSGLLLISDDHQLLHRLTSPKRHVDKRYRAKLAAPLVDFESAVVHFASGELVLNGEDRPCRAAELIATGDPLVVDIVLREGRYHQVRRMIAAVGGHVETLTRTAFGPWSFDLLPELARGTWVDVDASGFS
jgi:16S rRNA pseudouridine516 synthase